MTSIVCPILNERPQLLRMFNRLQELGNRCELIFVDGGSNDNSADIAGQIGRVFLCPRGRATQMNYGARHARGDAILFLHADTFIHPNTLEAIEDKVSGGYVGGCLTQKIDNRAQVYRLIEAQGNQRARKERIFYGDQGIFVSRGVFHQLGGFPEVPVMEDVLFTRKLRTAGQTAVLADTIVVSARRWEKKGIARTAFLYAGISALFRLKAPLWLIKSFYGELR